MKSVLFCFFLAITSLVSAQSKFMAGGRLGLGWSAFSHLKDDGGVFHYAFGGTARYTFAKVLSISADATISTLGGTYHGTELVYQDNRTTKETYKGYIHFTSLSIPLYPTITFGKGDVKVLVYTGMATNFNLFAYESRDYDDNSLIKDEEQEVLSNFNAVELFLIYGAGVQFQTGPSEYLMLDLRNSMPFGNNFTTVNEIEPQSGKMHYFTFNISYFF